MRQTGTTRAGVIDFRDPALRENALDVFWEIQKNDSIPRLKGLRSYLAISYADCDFILSSPDFGFEDQSSNLDQAKPELANYFAMRRGLMLFQNQPSHRESREQAKQMLAAWSAPEIRTMVREELCARLEELKAEGLAEWDFIALLAKPFVEQVAARLLKLPLDVVNEIAALTQEIADTLDPLSKTNTLEETGALYHRIDATVAECLKDQVPPSACPMHTQASPSVVAMMISASVYTTTHLLGLTTHGLLSDPEQADCFGRDKKVPASAVEELMRFHSPAQMTRRVALRRVQIRDQVFEKGTVFWLSLAAANRDPSVFGAPGVIDFTRNTNRHLAFGRGAHHCLGAQLARIELQVFLEEFSGAFPTLRLSSESSTPLHSLIFSGFRTLWVET